MINTTIAQICEFLEEQAPLAYQENYDNAGLLTGDRNWHCTGVLVSLDCIEAVVEEAIALKCNLIVAHHPILFKGLKSLTGKNYIERTLLKAIKHDIALYAIHTNLDNVYTGVNKVICDKIGLKNLQILAPKPDTLLKLELYGRPEDMPIMQEALFKAGAGKIGNYSECSFKTPGVGTYKPGDEANPTYGELNVRMVAEEASLSFLVEQKDAKHFVNVAKKASSYEELAYQLVPLANTNQFLGSGMVGELAEAMESTLFLQLLKSTFKCGSIKHTDLLNKTVRKIAVCGGAGSFLLANAKAAGADVFVSSDFKYHEFFDADKQLVICDIGHFESEQFTIELLANILKKNFTTFAVRLTSVNTNPVTYF